VYAGSVVPWHDPEFYVSPDRFGPAASLLSAALVGAVGLPGLALIALVRTRAAAGLARAALAAERGAESGALRRGRAVVRGEALGPAGTPLVRVRIRQVGRERQEKQGVYHTWTEVSRSVEAAPFMLRLASGERVRVEPGDNVFLVGQLTTGERPSEAERFRVADLAPGTHVYVEGVLLPPIAGGAYRDAEPASTLRPAGGGPMLISVDPPERRHELRAGLERAWARRLAIACLLVNLTAFGAFWLGWLDGRVEACAVVHTRAWTTRSKSGTARHLGVTAECPGAKGSDADVEVSAMAFAEVASPAIPPGEATLPFLVVPNTGLAWVGLRPNLGIGAVVFGWAAMLVAPLLYAWNVRHSRPWYEREVVVEEGRGPLGAPDALA